MAQKTDWKASGELIKASMSQEQPPIRIEKVMEVLGYTSKASAEYALIQLAKIGVVKWVMGKWYLL
jgi:hypothetical protein